MPYTAAAKKLMLAALAGTNPATPVTHVGAFAKGADITGITSTGSPDTFTKAGHGLANGDVVTFSALTAGAGLVVGRIYFVIGSTANTFQLATTPGGAAVDATTDATAATLNKWTEASGGAPAYARKAIAYNAPADPGTMDDSTNGAVLDIPAGGSVDALGLFSALAAGTLLVLEPVAHEGFTGQGTYTVTDSDLDLLQGA